ncbi:hypothetical protein C2S51_006386 [Perilla frutescens var. frutescens]|nr:hypothetical protein C2S51_006386 [Perilla frutescens var. frutescens]
MEWNNKKVRFPSQKRNREREGEAKRRRSVGVQLLPKLKTQWIIDSAPQFQSSATRFNYCSLPGLRLGMGFVKRVTELGLKSVSELRAANAAASPKSYRSFSSNSSTTDRLKDELISPPLHDQPAVRNLEAVDIPSEHVQAITSAITQVLDENYKPILQNLVTNSEMQNVLTAREANLSEFESEVRRIQLQDHLLRLEVKKLQTDIMKMRFSNRNEIATVTAGQYSGSGLGSQDYVDELIDRCRESGSSIVDLAQKIDGLRSHNDREKLEMTYKYSKILCASAVGILLISFLKVCIHLR